MMVTFPKQEVLDCCAQYGPMLKLPAGLDGRKVMASIASNESSTGANCGPRHEPAYDVGGALSKGSQQANALEEFGSAAACSYGPFQMMFVNFSGVRPDQLNTDIDLCVQGCGSFFNAYVIGARHAQTLTDIGQIWNCGHKTDSPSAGVALYCQHLQAAYDAA
jgi:hypothetical protein